MDSRRPMSPQEQFFFPPFRMDLATAQVWQGEAVVSLRPKTFAVLRYLVDHAGQVVPKADLLEALWPGVYGRELLFKRRIYELRQALGDTATTPRFIETIGRRGYRFIVPLTAPPGVRVQGSGEHRVNTLLNWQLATSN